METTVSKWTPYIAAGDLVVHCTTAQRFRVISLPEETARFFRGHGVIPVVPLDQEDDILYFIEMEIDEIDLEKEIARITKPRSLPRRPL